MTKQETNIKNNPDELIASVLSQDLEVPAKLLTQILSAIFWRQQLYAGLRLSGLALSSIVSSLALFFALKEVVFKMSESGAWSILSLVFSDLEVVTANWQAFSLSFLEALPIFSIILTTGAILAMLVSFRFVFRNLMQINFRPILKNRLLIKI